MTTAHHDGQLSPNNATRRLDLGMLYFIVCSLIVYFFFKKLFTDTIYRYTMNGHHEVAFQDRPPQYEQPQWAQGVGVGEG